jgi:hypothetical protein
MASSALERVAQLVEREEDLDTRSLSEIYQLHDELLLLQETENRRKEQLMSVRAINNSLVQYQVSPKALSGEDVALEADLYRAVIFLSVHLLSRLPPTTMSDSVREILGLTVQQAMLLLQILSRLILLCNGTTTEVRSNHPALAEWIQRRDEDLTDESSNLIVSLDAQALAMEEDELLRMANTPIPAVTGQRAFDGDYNEIFVARVDACHAVGSVESAMVAVHLDPQRGVFRLVNDASSMDGWWAALTGSSETQYLSPFLVITNVIIHKAISSRLIVDTLEVQVGQDDCPRWWEATSAVIQQLKELQTLHKQASSLWGVEAVEIQEVVAQRESIKENVALVTMS